jgi:HAD superfamily hydrolase (TIGR01459 family)
MIQTIDGLAALAGRYDVLLSDVWGVIHNGRESFPGPCAALARWRAEVGPVVLISNAARPSAPVAEQLDGLGVPRTAWSALVTSGDVTRRLLAERAPGPAYRIGADRDAPLYEGLGLDFAPLDEARFIACAGLVNDEVETPEDYRELLTAAAKRRLPMICANPDRVVQRGDGLIYCAGALAELYEALGGGEVVMAGKPFAPIYEACLARAGELLDRPVDKARVLAIGDGVVTDAKGANAQGIDLLFVAAGIHGAEMRDAAGRLDPAAAERLLNATGAHATYLADDLAWQG